MPRRQELAQNVIIHLASAPGHQQAFWPSAATYEELLGSLDLHEGLVWRRMYCPEA